jgi:quercetin 2,3-dioxygenase
MKKVIHRADDRGVAHHGWLHARHSFSFAGYHDAEKVHFGALRVLNDDIIAGGGGFPTHPHDNMEIVTIPLTGALQHKDSTGGNGIIEAGDVQIMSAGTGVRHSEFNASATDEVNLFQCWVFPKERNIAPRYDQRNFSELGRVNKWQTVVSPIQSDDALWINQDARFLLTKIIAGTSLGYANAFAGNGVYIMVINGAVIIDGETFEARDAVGIWESDGFNIAATTDAELLAIEVPMF